MKKTLIILLIAMLSACSSGGKQEVRRDSEESFAYHYNLGLAALEAKNYREAIGHFQDSLRLNNKIPRTHNELGLCYFYLGELNNAVDSFEKAVALDPNMGETHNSLGLCHLQLGNYRLAEQHFNAALATPSYPTPFIPLYNLGLMYISQGHDDYALTKFRQALQHEDKITPEYKIYLNHQMGSIQFRAGNYKKAIEHFEKVLVLNPKMNESAFQAGVAAMKSGNPELAKVMFRRVINNIPTSELADQAREYMRNLDIR